MMSVQRTVESIQWPTLQGGVHSSGAISGRVQGTCPLACRGLLAAGQRGESSLQHAPFMTILSPLLTLSYAVEAAIAPCSDAGRLDTGQCSSTPP
jgi:hypothetical protein